MAVSSRWQSGQDRPPPRGGDQQKPHLRSKPSPKELSNELETIVKWEPLLLNLGMEMHKIDIIKRDNRDDTSQQKLEAFNLWLKQTPNASWRDVIDALYEADENTLASDLKRKYAWDDPRAPSVKDRFVQTLSGGDRIKIIPVGDEPCRKILPPVKHGQDYFTLALTRDIQPRDVISQRSVDFFAGKMKPKLTEFIESIEKSESKDDFKVGIEARFGKVYWKLPNRAATWSPKTFSNLKKDLELRLFNPDVESCDVERLLDGRECLKEITQVPTLKFTVKGQDAGEYIAVIDEPRGTFVVDAVYSEPPRECRVKYDIALPGRKYDLRIGDCSASMLLEREHSLPYQIAREIAESMHRLPDNKLSLILRGETKKGSWEVKFFRQRVQKQYDWKRDKRWILVVYEVDTFDAHHESCSVNIEKAPVNEEVDIPNFNFSRKEIELWGEKEFPHALNKTRPSRDKYYHMKSSVGVKLPGENPQKPYVWTTENMMKDFHEFVGAAFEIATILDSSP